MNGQKHTQKLKLENVHKKSASVYELERALQKCEDEQFCVTQEITYKLRHPSEFIGNRQLFRVRGICNDEKIENLRNILSIEEDQQDKRRKLGHMPSNKEVLEQLRSDCSSTESDSNELSVFLNALIAVVWSVNGLKK